MTTPPLKETMTRPPATPRRTELQTVEEEKRPMTGQLARSVKIEQLTAFYGDNAAVKDVSLEFRPNAVTAIIGPSGCGKSTLVRCVNRMHEEIPGTRVEGRIALDEVDI
jgi:phosphate transport system ATP-binding protein